ncbi:MAG TPA: Lrp/AsnC family transcriptional regulator, partial [Chthonomonadales bacterium]|nr:Lrp/AsnC family transcriptional regulator [Chthonomonadales bacterium]
MSICTVPAEVDDPINSSILRVSEDKMAGFLADPLGEIALRCDLPVELVIDRIRAMMLSGAIRRVRQTLMATNLAKGALAAWQLPPEKLDRAFDFMYREDPFSGHVVVRSTESTTTGSSFRLWTTLKVPSGYSLEKHAA